MGIKGTDQLRRHMPDLDSPAGILRMFAVPVLLFFFVTAFFVTEDRTSPFWLLDGEVVLGTIGFLLMMMFFRNRENYRVRFGPQAYNVAARRFLFPGLAMVFAVIARFGYIGGPPIPPLWWKPILSILGWISLATGIVLWLRAVGIFGLDYLTMLYVYFPEESRVVDRDIYRILRHPIYAAAQYIAWGLALLNGVWFAICCAAIFSLGLWGWVSLVEERELLERLGDSYREYRSRVPAFWPRFHELGGFVRFLITGR